MTHKDKIVGYLSSPALLHYVLPVLMLYLVIGTVSQKYIGLYEATNIFFSSVIFWLGPLPMPGLPVFIGLIFANLAFKLLFKSPWNIRNAGIIITHIGALLLLLGGLFTALFSNEGYIDLAIGEEKSFTTDYHIREVVVLDEAGNILHTLDHQQLAPGNEIAIPGLSFTFKVLETCRNCKIDKRQSATDEHYGMAQHMQLSPGQLNHEDEKNLSGLTFRVNGTEKDGVYLVIENVPKLPQIKTGNQLYQVALRRQIRPLPFQIELLDFKREMYPGTALAKTYQSHVRIKDKDAQWEAMISMNEPLRYKGYTFFQSSFIETPDGDISVLAVVWNLSRGFPYISGIAMCLGLIIHLFVRRQRKPKQSQTKRQPAHAA